MRRLLLVSVLALAACGRAPQFDNSRVKEADPIQYSTVKTIIDGDLPGAARAKLAIGDGVLTQGEYNDIIADDGADEARYANDMAELKRSRGQSR